MKNSYLLTQSSFSKNSSIKASPSKTSFHTLLIKNKSNLRLNNSMKKSISNFNTKQKNLNDKILPQIFSYRNNNLKSKNKLRNIAKNLKFSKEKYAYSMKNSYCTTENDNINQDNLKKNTINNENKKIRKFFLKTTLRKLESTNDFDKNNLTDRSNQLNSKDNDDDEKKFKFSTLLKHLDRWDKDHCEIGKENNKTLFEELKDYYTANNLIEDKELLISIDNMLKSRKNIDLEIEDRKYGSKVLLDILQKRKKEKGSILKNNLFKTQMRYREIFSKKYFKDFSENFNIDEDVLKILIEDEVSWSYYNKLIKEKIKYEKQLHEEIIKVNNIIYNKKILKKEKEARLEQLFNEKCELKKEYNKDLSNNQNMYWNQYTENEKIYNSLIPIRAQSHDTFDPNFNFSRNRKTRTAKEEEFKKQEFEEQIKNFNMYKQHKLSIINYEMNTKLINIQNIYEGKFNKIENEEKIIEKDINFLNTEMLYYKQANEELFREHRKYYLEKLKNGFDCRGEGLVWVVKNLFELRIQLEYHHFPKYLTHEHIDYLKDLANVMLELNELNIIITVLKKKQSTQKMNDAIKCMDVIDNIITEDIKDNNSSKEENKINDNKEEKLKLNHIEGYSLDAKNKIDKKFYKVYKDNIDVMKNYIKRNREIFSFQNVIEEIKKDLYFGCKNDEMTYKSTSNILKSFMGDNKEKDFFTYLLNIKARHHQLEEIKEKMIEDQIKAYYKYIKGNASNKPSACSVVKNEMIKRCLFGARLEY